jgi:hypothetical protein
MVPMGLVRHRHMSRSNSGGFVRQAGVPGQSNSAMGGPLVQILILVFSGHWTRADRKGDNVG